MPYKIAILSVTLALVLQACGGSSTPGGPLEQAEANTSNPQPDTGSTTDNQSVRSATVYGFWKIDSQNEASLPAYWQINETGVLTTYDYLADAIPLDDTWSIQYCYTQQNNDILRISNGTYEIYGPVNQSNYSANNYELNLSDNGELLTIISTDVSEEFVKLARAEDTTQAEDFFICPTQAPDLDGFNSGIDLDNNGTRYTCNIQNLLNLNEEPRETLLYTGLGINGYPSLSYSDGYYSSSYANGALALGQGSTAEYHTLAYAKTIKFGNNRLENDLLSFIHESQTIDAETNKPAFLEAFHCSRIDRTVAFMGFWKADSRGFRNGNSYAYPEPLKRFWHVEQDQSLTIYTHNEAANCYETATGKLSYQAFNPRFKDIVDDKPGFSDFYHTSVTDDTTLSVKNKFSQDCDEYGYSCTYVDHIDETYQRATDITSTEQLPLCNPAPVAEQSDTDIPGTNIAAEDRTRPDQYALFTSDQSEVKDNGSDFFSNTGNPPQRVEAERITSWPGLRYGNLLVSNNAWNSIAASYPDWYQEISLFETTNGYGVTFDWDWGAEADTNGSPFTTRSFPEVIFGSKSPLERSGTFAETGLPVEIYDAPELGIFYDYNYQARHSASGNTSGTDSEFNVAIKAVFHNTCDIKVDGSSTDTPVFELMIWLKTGDRKPSADAPKGTIKTGFGNSYIIYTQASNPNDIAFVAETDTQSGGIGFDELVSHVQNNASEYGIYELQDTDCLGHISLGTEIWHGAGTFNLNSFHISRSYFR